MPKRKDTTVTRTYSLREVHDMIQMRAEELGSQAALARELGTSRAFVCDLCLGFRPPSKRVLDYLGLEQVYIETQFKKKGS